MSLVRLEDSILRSVPEIVNGVFRIVIYEAISLDPNVPDRIYDIQEHTDSKVLDKWLFDNGYDLPNWSTVPVTEDV